MLSAAGIAEAKSLLKEQGFARLDGFTDGATLQRLRRSVMGLEQETKDAARSTHDIVLEAEGDGGWVAWQRASRPLPGVLRSVARLHEHARDVGEIADSVAIRCYVVERIVAAAATLVNSFLWAKPPVVGSAKPWHQDMAFAPSDFTRQYSTVVTLWLALDPVTEQNGCLEFISGSHHRGLLAHVGDQERGPGDPPLPEAIEPRIDLAATFPDARPTPMPLDAGSAVLFDGYMVHCSQANRSTTPRRAVSFVYALRQPEPMSSGTAGERAISR